MKELLISLAKGLVENPDAVTVTEDEVNEEGVIVFHLHVSARRHFSGILYHIFERMSINSYVRNIA